MCGIDRLLLTDLAGEGLGDNLEVAVVDEGVRGLWDLVVRGAPHEEPSRRDAVARRARALDRRFHLAPAARGHALPEAREHLRNLRAALLLVELLGRPIPDLDEDGPKYRQEERE